MRIVHDGVRLFYCWAERSEDKRLPIVRKGVVRNIEPPYRHGRGIEFRMPVPWRPVDVGVGVMFVWQRRIEDEDEGMQRALGTIDIEFERDETDHLIVGDTGERLSEWA